MLTRSKPLRRTRLNPIGKRRLKGAISLRRGMLNPIGRKGRANRAAARRRRQVARSAGWLVCEVGPLLVERGLTNAPCSGMITLCHSLKTSARRQLVGEARQQADNETAGGCTQHHYFCLDVQAPAVTAAIVRDAIARRS